MKPFLIGRYQLGFRMVALWAEPGRSGGWFNLCKNESEAQIHVCMDYKDEGYAWQVLCHEVFEMAADDRGCTWGAKNSFVGDASDSILFVYDHNQHTEIVARASFFILSCIDDWRKAYRGTGRTPKKRKTPKKRPLARKRSGK